jgi:hypothetical protein
MTPKEKAIELLSKMYSVDEWGDYSDPSMSYRHDKICALIAVEEMIKELDELLEGDERTSAGDYYLWEYYKEVKQEIEKL